MKECLRCHMLFSDNATICNICGMELPVLQYAVEKNNIQNQRENIGYFNQIQCTNSSIQNGLSFNSGFIQGNIKKYPVKNILSLVTSIVSVIAVFSTFLSTWKVDKVSIMEFARLMRKYYTKYYADGFLEKIIFFMSGLLPYALIGICVLTFIGAFKNVSKYRKKVLLLCTIIFACVLISIIKEGFFKENVGEPKIGAFLSLASIVMAWLTQKTEYKENVGRILEQGQWICPNCDAINNSAVCKMCGSIRNSFWQCSNCGNLNVQGKTFCLTCGKK